MRLRIIKGVHRYCSFFKSMIFSGICWQSGDPLPPLLHKRWTFYDETLNLSWRLLLYQSIIKITGWHHIFTYILTPFCCSIATVPDFGNVLQDWNEKLMYKADEKEEKLYLWFMLSAKKSFIPTFSLWGCRSTFSLKLDFCIYGSLEAVISASLTVSCDFREVRTLRETCQAVFMFCFVFFPSFWDKRKL